MDKIGDHARFVEAALALHRLVNEFPDTTPDETVLIEYNDKAVTLGHLRTLVKGTQKKAKRYSVRVTDETGAGLYFTHSTYYTTNAAIYYARELHGSPARVYDDRENKVIWPEPGRVFRNGGEQNG